MGIVIDSNNNVYCANNASSGSNINSVLVFNSSGSLLYSLTSSVNIPSGLGMDSQNNLFVSNMGASNIVKFVSGQTSSITFASISGGSNMGIAFNNTDTMYYSYMGSSSAVYTIPTVNTLVFTNVSTSSLSIGPNLMSLSYNGSSFGGPITVLLTGGCFQENTKILCENGKYISIQDLQIGDLVKTMSNEFKPIVHIMKKKFTSNEDNDDVLNKLYIVSKNKYPELFDDLVITGGHAILMDCLTNEEQKQMCSIYKTDAIDILTVNDKYKLLPCFNKDCNILPIHESINVYHIALENDNDKAVYGIYANGLLVESCSIEYCKNI